MPFMAAPPAAAVCNVSLDRRWRQRCHSHVRHRALFALQPVRSNALARHSAIVFFQLDQDSIPAEAVRGHGRRAGAAERIEHHAARRAARADADFRERRWHRRKMRIRIGLGWDHPNVPEIPPIWVKIALRRIGAGFEIAARPDRLLPAQGLPSMLVPAPGGRRDMRLAARHLAS